MQFQKRSVSFSLCVCPLFAVIWSLILGPFSVHSGPFPAFDPFCSFPRSAAAFPAGAPVLSRRLLGHLRGLGPLQAQVLREPGAHAEVVDLARVARVCECLELPFVSQGAVGWRGRRFESKKQMAVARVARKAVQKLLSSERRAKSSKSQRASHRSRRRTPLAFCAHSGLLDCQDT